MLLINTRFVISNFIFCFPAYNVRNTEIGAVIGLNQLKGLDKNISKRNNNLKYFLSRIRKDIYFTDFDLKGCSNYAFNIILNWLVEDLIFWNLYRSKIDVKKNGSDRNRVLLSGKNVTADSDLKIKKSNELIYLEVISNYPTHKGYSSFWEQDGSFDLRDNKLSNMLLESKNAKVYIIGVVVAKSAFFIMQIDKNIKVNKVSSQKNIGFKKTNQIIFKNKEIQLNPINKLQEHIK